MKNLKKKKKKKKKFFFFFFFFEIGIFFSNWEKSHLNPIGKGAEFRPLRTPKKIPADAIKLNKEQNHTVHTIWRKPMDTEKSVVYQSVCLSAGEYFLSIFLAFIYM